MLQRGSDTLKCLRQAKFGIGWPLTLATVSPWLVRQSPNLGEKIQECILKIRCNWYHTNVQNLPSSLWQPHALSIEIGNMAFEWIDNWTTKNSNWPNSQIPQSTCTISHNAPFGTETAHLCSVWCIVGYGTGDLWDLWDGSNWRLANFVMAFMKYAHYIDDSWASWRTKSQATLLFVQQLSRLTLKEI